MWECTSKPPSKRSFFNSKPTAVRRHTIGQYRRHGTALANWLAEVRAPTTVAKLTPALLAKFFADDAAKNSAEADRSERSA